MGVRETILNKKQRAIEIPSEMEAINAVAESENRDLTDEETGQVDALLKESDANAKSINQLEKVALAADKIAQNRVASEVAVGNQPAVNGQRKLPAVPRHQKSKYFENNADAFNVGMWLGATVARKPECRQWCKEHGIGAYRNAQEEGTDTLGGFTVPTPLSNQIIDLVEQWGVYRMDSRNVTMTSETLQVPVLVNEIVPGTASGMVYYPGEGAAITPADRTFAQVLLTAVKYAQLTLMSTELSEDSIISVVDLLVRDFARHFAYAEDLNSFTGDGSGTYGGITGITSALQAGAKVTLGATSTAVTDITLADLNNVAGIVPAYAGFSGKYYMSKEVWYGHVLGLLQAAGGTDMRQLEEGGRPILNGDPVIWTQVLPGMDAAAGSIPIIYGDLDLGSYMGTRRSVSIRTLNELYAATDQIGVIGTLRSDSVIHSVGTADDAGAITAIELAAS